MQIFPDPFSTADFEALAQRIIINTSVQYLLELVCGMQT